LLSGGREGDVTNKAGPSFRFELLNGDEPARVRTGILLNLICCAALCAASKSSSLSSLRSLLSSSPNCSFRRLLFVFNAGPTVSLLPPPPVTIPPSSSSSPKLVPGRPADRGAWKYSDATAVGIGGEYVRLISAALGTHPAARNAGLLRTDVLTLISRSPTPSLMHERYAVLS